MIFPNTKTWLNCSVSNAIKTRNAAYKNSKDDPVKQREAKLEVKKAVKIAKRRMKAEIEESI